MIAMPAGKRQAKPSGKLRAKNFRHEVFGEVCREKGYESLMDQTMEMDMMSGRGLMDLRTLTS